LPVADGLGVGECDESTTASAPVVAEELAALLDEELAALLDEGEELSGEGCDEAEDGAAEGPDAADADATPRPPTAPVSSPSRSAAGTTCRGCIGGLPSP
jgi:hypothetical protein